MGYGDGENEIGIQRKGSRWNGGKRRSRACGISPCVRESSAGESGWKIGTWKHRERSGEFIYETNDAQKWGSSIGAESG